MSIVEFGSGDKFIFRIVKYLTTNPSNKWANSYEVVSTAAGDTSAVLGLANALVLFEANIHNPKVKFFQALCSTWEADSKPYDPEAFLSLPLNQIGLRNAVGDLLGLNTTWTIARVPTSGRFGHLFYRGCLIEGDVEAPAGKTVLTNPTTLANELDDAVEVSELDVYLNGSTPGPFTLSMINKDGTQIRPVNSLVSLGCSALPLDHAWFNRTKKESTP